MMTIFHNILNIFFPPICIICENRLVSNETHICLNCLLKLPWTNYCRNIANKLEENMSGRFPFERIASFGYFTKDGAIQKLIHELKYKNNPSLGIYIGKICAKDMLNSNFLSDIDYLIPVPIHPKRLKERGYNQALKIGEGISSVSNIPLETGNLIRSVYNQSQTTQSRFERWNNTEGAFSLLRPEILEQKHILLIDDVITTGSTIESCVKTIVSSVKKIKISIYGVGSIN